MDPSSITLAVLAGGAGSRMGAPKSHLMVQGQTVLRWLSNQWKWDGPTLLVTAPGREHPPGSDAFDREVVDAVADQGPLRGVLTALEAATGELVVMTTCDMPTVRREQLDWIVHQFENDAQALALFLRHDDKIEPFPCILRKSADALVRARLDSNDHSMQALAKLPRCSIRSAPPDWPSDTWTNLNHPRDLPSGFSMPTAAPARSDRKYPEAPPGSSPKPPASSNRRTSPPPAP
jgi:molybdenum cofactor guanylyltransferase